MSERHLTDEELDRWLSGEELDQEVAEHAATCLLCWHRRANFLGAVAAARAAEPEAATLERWRETALERWSGGSAPRHRWWLAAAAVLFLVALLPVVAHLRAPRADLDAETVVQEVDTLLASDPLTALAPEELLETVVPAGGNATGGGVS
ncbi:MAG: hypothetical protein HXY19_01260 [Thermoanaerobaculaceae bacterium]|nr:hypothetical protein [Thermoanaerobaculaceae bacterium]